MFEPYMYMDFESVEEVRWDAIKDLTICRVEYTVTSMDWLKIRSIINWIESGKSKLVVSWSIKPCNGNLMIFDLLASS